MTIGEIKEAFAKDKFATDATGIAIDEAHDNYARCSFVIQAHHLNSLGTVMGGAIFTLADFTFAVAANTQGLSAVALGGQIAYHGVAKGAKVIAEARCVKDGRSTCFYIVDITDDVGTNIATATFTGFKKTAK